MPPITSLASGKHANALNLMPLDLVESHESHANALNRWGESHPCLLPLIVCSSPRMHRHHDGCGRRLKLFVYVSDQALHTVPLYAPQ